MTLMSEAAGNPDFSEVTGLDRLIHEPARLAVMALLYVIDGADFTFLMNQTGLTWGNLSAHLSKLEEVGYLAAEKTFIGRRPNTTPRLTEVGRQAFHQYVRMMKQIIRDFPTE